MASRHRFTIDLWLWNDDVTVRLVLSHCDLSCNRLLCKHKTKQQACINSQATELFNKLRTWEDLITFILLIVVFLLTPLLASSWWFSPFKSLYVENKIGFINWPTSGPSHRENCSQFLRQTLGFIISLCSFFHETPFRLAVCTSFFVTFTSGSASKDGREAILAEQVHLSWQK